MTTVKIIVFSKDRPLQLDACLRSLYLRCRDWGSMQLSALVRPSLESFRFYRQLEREHPALSLVAEQDFAADLLRLLAETDYVLFMVDDCVCYRDFDLSAAVNALERDETFIGFSLRLGRNITDSYLFGRGLTLPPVISDTGLGVIFWRWPGADEAWGYPLEISSSLYRVRDLLPIIAEAKPATPNALETALYNRCEGFAASRPLLASFDQSAAYDIQLNRSNTTHANKCSNDPRTSIAALLQRYEEGYRADVSQLPAQSAVFAEIELPLAIRSQ